jgi:hypothetical protein
MGGRLKTLIAVACLAAIAFVGYFFWNEYRSSVSARETSECESVIRYSARERSPQGSPVFGTAEKCVTDGKVSRERFNELVRQVR